MIAGLPRQLFENAARTIDLFGKKNRVAHGRHGITRPEQWERLSSIVVIESDRRAKGKQSTSDRRYFISNRAETAENVAVLRRMVVNLPRGEKTGTGGVDAKRCRAGWDEDSMQTVFGRALGQLPSEGR